MDEQRYIETFCTGCGLCHSACGTRLILDENGFPVAALERKQDVPFCKNVCPVFNYSTENEYDIWGNINAAVVGYSANPHTRFKAASGGALTEICIFLLNRGIVDGIIHTTYDPDDPTKAISCISTTEEEVISRCGSRYSISVPLQDILQIIECDKKYAFVGKPCDVMALRRYMEIDDKLSSSIKYLLSFFCAGEPSVNAQKALLQSVNCTFDDIKSITYRGNGWPGYTTIEKKTGEVFKLDYKSAWGKYLGRDLRPICRFCLDGTGDAADIVCADFWHLNTNGDPDFSEHNGRNIIFSRTDEGRELLNEVIKSGRIICEEDYLGQMSNFYKYQPAQYKRKGTMKSMIFAMRLCKHVTPRYNRAFLSRCSKNMTLKTKIQYFTGTICRVLKGKM